MGTVAAANAGVADLLQIVSNAGSQSLSSALSSSNLQSALQAASPADIVQLSSQALQLQVTNALFANPSQTNEFFSPSGLNAALNNMLANLYSPTPPAAPASSLASQIATYQSNLQTEQLQALFGVDPTAGTPGSLVNVVA